MAQPYYNQAQGLFNQSAGPIGASQINNYLNPYAGYVMQNLQEQQGQQMHDLTGKATQAAGGVGADRIGVAQGELARQQGLANGQTLSGIWGNALSAAQQDAQRQQSAAYGIGNLGGAAQNAALQGTSALYGAGSQQQQLNQAQLNAPYQNELARQAFPYQNANFLAGITGGLAPTLGGTTNSNQTTTAPAPSLFSQIFGGLAGGAGALGATGAFGTNGWLGQAFGDPASYGNGNGVYGGSASNPLPGLTANDYGNRGGRVGFADGGGVPGGGMDWMHSDPTIPQVNIQPAQMHYPEVRFSDPSKASGSSGGGMGDIAKIAQMAMMFVNRGGRVDGPPYQGFARGGEASDNPYSLSSHDLAGDYSNDPSGYLMDDSADPAAGYGGGKAPFDFNDRFVDPGNSELPYAPNFDQRFNAATSGTAPFTPPTGTPGNPYRMPDVKADGSPIVPDDSAIPLSAKATNGAPTRVPVTGGEEEPLSPAANKTAAENLKAMKGLKFDTPYESPSEDEGRRFAKSPWLALMNAGFATMGGTSPFAGVNIGKGFQEGVKTLGEQRKAGHEEESINQRAKQLALTAQAHLDSYTKMTPKEAADIENKQAALELIKGVKVYENPIDGTSIWDKGGKITKYGPNGPMPLTAADASIVASKGGNPKVADASGTVPAASEGEPAMTSISPPGGTVVNKSPEEMYQPRSVEAQRNPEILAGYGSKDAARYARMQAGPEVKAWNEGAKGADKVQFRAAEMKSSLDTIMAYVNKKPNGLAEQALQAAIKPGPGAETATQMASWLSKFGTGLPPEVLAAAQTWGKNATLAGFAGIVGEGLSAREAMPIIRASMGAVAQIGLPEASSRALLASMNEVAQRTKDQQKFLSQYIARNGGIANGWREEFEKHHPMGEYVARAVVSALPPAEREKLGPATQSLRQYRDGYMAAEKSGDQTAIGPAREKYIKAKAAFDRMYGGTSDYFAFGKIM